MNNFQEGEIYTFKLGSGEELIAKVTACHIGQVILSNPLSVAPNPQGMGLIPGLFTAERDKPVTLNTGGVTMWCETDDTIRSKYIEATTGIATASKKLVLG